MTDNNTTKELLLSSLISFYSNDKNNYKEILKIIIDGKHDLSLRMIDWLVTRYSKNNNIIYWINENDNNIYYNLPDNYSNEKYMKINLYLDYRAQLKSFKKFNFDAFRRHERIKFYIGNNDNKNGSGLGLSIISDLLKSMGSKLCIHSIKNKGSVFNFEIPIELEKKAFIKKKSS